MLARVSSEGITTLLSQPSLFTTLQSNTYFFRQILNKLEALPLGLPSSDPSYNAVQTPSSPNKDAIISIPSHPHSALIHIFLLNPPPTVEQEEALLQEVVDELLANSQVLITRARRLRDQETFEPEPSLKVFMSSVFSRKELEKAAQGLRQALVKVAGSRSLSGVIV